MKSIRVRGIHNLSAENIYVGVRVEDDIRQISLSDENLSDILTVNLDTILPFINECLEKGA